MELPGRQKHGSPDAARRGRRASRRSRLPEETERMEAVLLQRSLLLRQAQVSATHHRPGRMTAASGHRRASSWTEPLRSPPPTSGSGSRDSRNERRTAIKASYFETAPSFGVGDKCSCHVPSADSFTADLIYVSLQLLMPNLLKIDVSRKLNSLQTFIVLVRIGILFRLVNLSRQQSCSFILPKG